MLWVVLLGIKAESEDEKRSQDQRDRLDSTWAQIAVRQLSEELRKSMQKGRESGAQDHLLPASFTRLGKGFYKFRGLQAVGTSML